MRMSRSQASAQRRRQRLDLPPRQSDLGGDLGVSWRSKAERMMAAPKLPELGATPWGRFEWSRGYPVDVPVMVTLAVYRHAERPPSRWLRILASPGNSHRQYNLLVSRPGIVGLKPGDAREPKRLYPADFGSALPGALPDRLSGRTTSRRGYPSSSES